MTTVTCPSPRCRREIVPKVCQTIVSKEILNQWTKALSELKKFKCPYKDCSEMLVDNNRKKPGTSSECPRCKQLYCPHCKVVWHSEMDCKEFQGEREQGDLLLMKLAKINSWQRCPKCKFYVDRRDGCPRIDCRCGCVDVFSVTCVELGSSFMCIASSFLVFKLNAFVSDLASALAPVRSDAPEMPLTRRVFPLSSCFQNGN
ncbi:zinc finger, C6HC-type containing protein [Tanacetum coccineum]